MPWIKCDCEDESTWYEYIRPYWRFGLLLEELPEESSWYFVTKGMNYIALNGKIGRPLYRILKEMSMSEIPQTITVPLFSKALFRELWNMYWRCKAHAAFDPLWQNCGMSRNAAYRWLAKELGLSRDECHMSRFNAAMSQHVIEVCRRREQ